MSLLNEKCSSLHFMQVVFQDIMSLYYEGEGNPAKLHGLDADGKVVESLEVFDYDDFDIAFL